MIQEKIKQKLLKNKYKIYRHSAIQICRWTKKALRNSNAKCYKEKFYGVDTHRCVQFSPAAIWCPNNCIFCWRTINYIKPKNYKQIKHSSPKTIINNLVELRKLLISGFKGSSKINIKKFKESYNLFPSHWAISLSGEPCLYPYLPELIKILKNKKEAKSIFLVTNGLYPKMIKKLKNSLPTQLYVSMAYSNETLFKKITNSKLKNAWKRYLETLNLLKNLKCRTVIRLTLIKDLNDYSLKEYSNLIKLASPDFIEIRSYIDLSKAKENLGYKYMLNFQELKSFSNKLLKDLPKYKYEDSMKESLVILLSKRKPRYNKFIKNVHS